MRGSELRKRGKRWAFTVDLPRGDDDKRRQKMYSAATKKAAETLRTQVLGEIDNSTYIDPTKVTLGGYLDEWIAAIQPAPGSGVKPSTWQSYAMNVNAHIKPRLGAIPLQKLTGTRLSAFYRELLIGGRSDGKGGLNPRTVRYIRMLLKKALSDGVMQRRISHNPADVSDKIKLTTTREMKCWNKPELRAFLDYVQEHDPRYFAPFVLLAASGVRRGELLGLAWSSVDLDTRRATILQTLLAIRYKIEFGTPKTKKGARTIVLDSVTADVLRQHRLRQVEEKLSLGAGYNAHGLVFVNEVGEPIHPDAFSARFDRLVKAAELPRIRLHDVRHTAATLMLASGVPAKVASERLGHATASFTLDQYVHVVSGQQEDAADRMGAAIWG